MSTGKPFKGYAETFIKPRGHGQLKDKIPIFLVFLCKKNEIEMKSKAGTGKGKTRGCNDCDNCNIPGSHPDELQTLLLQEVVGKIKNRDARVTIFHTSAEIFEQGRGQKAGFKPLNIG